MTGRIRCNEANLFDDSRTTGLASDSPPADAGILFFALSKGKVLFVLYGILTLTLCGGDAFHLIPRVIRAFKGSSEKIEKQLGVGLRVSSVTMTIFYILLLFIRKQTFVEMKAPAVLETIIWVCAIVRIAICFLPQNNWCSEEGNPKLSLIRNNTRGASRECMRLFRDVPVGEKRGMTAIVMPLLRSFCLKA